MSSTTSTTASSTSPSAQGSSRTNASDPEVTALMSEVAVANQSAEVQPAQARTDKTSSTQQQNQETAEKLDKIQAQNQTPGSIKRSVKLESKGKC